MTGLGLLRVVTALVAAAPLVMTTYGVTARDAPANGRIKVVGANTRGAAPIVYAERLDGSSPSRPGRFVLAQKGKMFMPRVLPVPVGSTVDFPNEDQIFHNVFSLSTPQSFDLGLYRAGSSKDRTFTQPGLYRVFCNIHPSMSAVIMVLSTPHITHADASGAYALDLPPGRYRVTAWSERSTPSSAEIALAQGAQTLPDLTLDESSFVETPHKNKFGKEYPKNAYDALNDKKR